MNIGSSAFISSAIRAGAETLSVPMIVDGLVNEVDCPTARQSQCSEFSSSRG